MLHVPMRIIRSPHQHKINNMDQYNQDTHEDEVTENRSGGSNWTIPIAIVIAGIMIAGAVYYSGTNASRQEVANSGKASDLRESSPPAFGSGSVDNIKPINDQDHILGDPNAPVKVVEFSDTECPFCKRFHPTMHQLIQEYGQSGQVAWVYRHFPLDSIHSKARKEAEATECANELGGNAKFWAYTDRLFEVTPSNNNLDLAELPKIAEFVGLDRTQFEQCLNSGKYAQHVADDLADAINSGGQGTPHSIVIAPNGQKFPISGAQPYPAVKQVVEAALKLK